MSSLSQSPPEKLEMSNQTETIMSLKLNQNEEEKIHIQNISSYSELFNLFSCHKYSIEKFIQEMKKFCMEFSNKNYNYQNISNEYKITTKDFNNNNNNNIGNDSNTLLIKWKKK